MLLNNHMFYSLIENRKLLSRFYSIYSYQYTLKLAAAVVSPHSQSRKYLVTLCAGICYSQVQTAEIYKENYSKRKTQ